MRARRPALLLAAGLLLTACAGAPAATDAVAPDATAPAPPAAAAGPRTVVPGPPATSTASTRTSPDALPLEPVLAGPRPTGPVLPASAGALVDADVPGAQQAVNVDVAFGGVVLGGATGGGTGGDRVVGYPSLALQAAFDGTVVAHLKLARFTCRSSASPSGPPDRDDCRGRTVDYADADARSTSVTVADDGVVAVEVTANAYRYGAGLDRDPRLRPRPTGERLALRAEITPGAVLSRRGRHVLWRPLGEVRDVTIGRPGLALAASGRAAQDDGYANTYRAVLRGR